MHAHTRTCANIYTRIHTHTQIHKNKHIIHTNRHMCTPARTRTRTHAFTHTHRHTKTHAHSHTSYARLHMIVNACMYIRTY